MIANNVLAGMQTTCSAVTNVLSEKVFEADGEADIAESDAGNWVWDGRSSPIVISPKLPGSCVVGLKFYDKR